MEKLQPGNVVKSKTNDRLMIINKRRVSKQGFNNEAIGYLIDDKDIDEGEIYIYVCFVEENGITTKLEFKRDELIFIRDTY